MSAANSTHAPSTEDAVLGSSAPVTPGQRREPRLKLPAMYTLVRVRMPGDEHYRWTGHIYDISLSGMRFELDEPLEADTPVEIRAMLPGYRHTLVRAQGRIVRLHDDHPTIAPVRMAMHFDRFHNEIDHYRLANYLAGAGLERSAAHSMPFPTVRRPAA